LVTKIEGVLKENNITLWDAMLTSNLSVTEQSMISVREFKMMLRPLNLNLTLKEKLLLVKIFDPDNTGVIDLQKFINYFDKGVSFIFLQKKKINMKHNLSYLLI
jgi:hypothetical protein